MLNELRLIGRLGKEPETRSVGSSTACKFSIAVDDGYFNKQGQWVDQAIWVDVSVWDKLAEKCQTLEKGERVLVLGKLKINKVDGENGTRYFTECAAKTVRRLDPKKAGETFPQPQQLPQGNNYGGKDDLPF